MSRIFVRYSRHFSFTSTFNLYLISPFSLFIPGLCLHCGWVIRRACSGAGGGRRAPPAVFCFLPHSSLNSSHTFKRSKRLSAHAHIKLQSAV